ncbi:hypothetical protein EMIHUDRAFT_310645 [Emiliania huxleyi CCMP1516]|uniref:Uncharacterized protein n=2 Tax=Emiliania huxleyi TaxID=2903 RepID=A0A0D3J7J3_EMIH1|nr:hypothetical protein EMIHUDRAFT_310645 [Emiliania huxleyi CCMP1516]EOD19478.1 hypothetical protein EMIHUDRAFT_310645 [Emiliania huxleyi CCMP1516]|eukprot:XP_005771907.1 hypothetical protein EMIHUDRAFT_310645 [Emiliania huxleyi CCMP1516]
MRHADSEPPPPPPPISLPPIAPPSVSLPPSGYALGTISESGALHRSESRGARSFHSCDSLSSGRRARRPSFSNLSEARSSFRLGAADLGADVSDMLKTARTDLQHLPGVLRKHQRQFYFMRSDCQPVHGLRDWTQDEWRCWLARFPRLGDDLARGLLRWREGEAEDVGPEACAIAIKIKMNQSLTYSDWHLISVFQNRALNAGFGDGDGAIHYFESDLLSNYIFDREFPLGERILQDRHRFAINHSGVHRIEHRQSKAEHARSLLTFTVYFVLALVALVVVIYLLALMVGQSELWVINATVQDFSDGNDPSTEIVERTKSRGEVASLLATSMLDKFGLIDPSSSTVFIGMFLGGTWGFVLDQIFGSDEGYREYLWSPQDGMKYAMGVLVSERYGRYLVTILFDM